MILDDAQRPNQFSQDEYSCGAGGASALCLPLVKQAELIGLIYLETTWPPAHSFQRIAVLEVLAAQAAISLENARLYTELRLWKIRERTKAEASRRGAADRPHGKLAMECQNRYRPVDGRALSDLRRRSH